MNLVIACDKRIQKQVSGFKFKEHNHNVLAYINEIGSNFADRIENNLPHILVIFNGINDKDNVLSRSLSVYLSSFRICGLYLFMVRLMITFRKQKIS